MLKVSDHALVRFLDRAGGLAVEDLRAELAGSLERARCAAGAIGIDEYVVVADGLEYIIRDGTLITILVRGGAP